MGIYEWMFMDLLLFPANRLDGPLLVKTNHKSALSIPLQSSQPVRHQNGLHQPIAGHFERLVVNRLTGPN